MKDSVVRVLLLAGWQLSACYPFDFEPRPLSPDVLVQVRIDSVAVSGTLAQLNYICVAPDGTITGEDITDPPIAEKKWDGASTYLIYSHRCGPWQAGTWHVAVAAIVRADWTGRTTADNTEADLVVYGPDRYKTSASFVVEGSANTVIEVRYLGRITDQRDGT